MRNFEIIKEIYKITHEEDGRPCRWDRDGVEQLDKIQKLIEHRRPLQFPQKKEK